jgi:hypothetical protein
VPPERIVRSFWYSAFASACFSSAVRGFELVSTLCFGRSLSSSSSSRASFSCASCPPLPYPSGGGLKASRSSLSCFWGGGLSRRGDGDREGGDRFREEGPGEKEPPGGGVGTRTADCNIIVSAIWARAKTPQNTCSRLDAVLGKFGKMSRVTKNRNGESFAPTIGDFS